MNRFMNVINNLLSPLKIWIIFNASIISIIAATHERYQWPGHVFGASIAAFIFQYHYLPSIIKIIYFQWVLALIIVVFYWFYIRITEKLSLIVLIPTSMLTLLIVSSILGTNPIRQIQAKNSSWVKKNYLSPVFEIHLKKKSKINPDDLDDMVMRVSRRYHGAIFYTVSPMSVSGLLRRNHIATNFHLSLTTKVKPSRAIKYQGRKKPFKLYIFENN